MKKIRILLADDHAIVRSGLAAVLGFEDDLEVVGEAANGQRAVKLAAELKPDVVVMDLMMPVLNGAEATAKIRAADPDVNVLVLTTYGSSADIGRALEAGAAGAIMKSASNREIKSAIRHVAAGRRHVAPEIAAELADTPEPALTGRQAEILEAATRGFTNEDIARQLGITASCVKQHLSAVFQKLGVATRAEATALALRKQLLKI